MAPAKLVSTLHDYINAASSAADILRLLRLSNMEDLKAFAHQQIEKMDSDLQRCLYYTARPINKVLHGDVMQHILSFRDYEGNINDRIVCIQWNGLCKVNEGRMLREAYQLTNEKFPASQPPGNSTWVWRRGRNRLHPVEQGLGFKGPLNRAEDVEALCKSGDRVFIHGIGDVTTFRLGGAGWGWDSKKKLHVIGLSANQRFEISIYTHNLVGHLVLDNLSVKFKNPIAISGELTMRQCNIEQSAMRVEGNGTLNVDRCTLRAKAHAAIEISPWAHQVDICKSTIKGVRRGIAIEGQVNGQKDDLVQIKITDNVFEEMLEYAVVESTRRVFNEHPLIIGTDRCILYGNTTAVGRLRPNTLLHVED